MANVDWSSCNTDERLFYDTLVLRSVFDELIGLVKTCKWDANGIFVMESALSSRKVLWYFLVEHRIRFLEAMSLMQIEGDECEDDFSDLQIAVNNMLAVQAFSEDDCHL